MSENNRIVTQRPDHIKTILASISKSGLSSQGKNAKSQGNEEVKGDSPPNRLNPEDGARDRKDCASSAREDHKSAVVHNNNHSVQGCSPTRKLGRTKFECAIDESELNKVELAYFKRPLPPMNTSILSDK